MHNVYQWITLHVVKPFCATSTTMITAISGPAGRMATWNTVQAVIPIALTVGLVYVMANYPVITAAVMAVVTWAWYFVHATTHTEPDPRETNDAQGN